MTNEDKIGKILNDTSRKLENWNYHEMVGLPESLFKAIEKLVPIENHKKLAKIISKNLISRI